MTCFILFSSRSFLSYYTTRRRNDRDIDEHFPAYHLVGGVEATQVPDLVRGSGDIHIQYERVLYVSLIVLKVTESERLQLIAEGKETVLESERCVSHVTASASLLSGRIRCACISETQGLHPETLQFRNGRRAGLMKLIVGRYFTFVPYTPRCACSVSI